MVFEMVAIIPIYLHLTLCINATTAAQAFCVWQAFLLTFTCLENDFEHPQDRPQEYRLYSHST